jgi:hypothetical protein
VKTRIAFSFLALLFLKEGFAVADSALHPGFVDEPIGCLSHIQQNSKNPCAVRSIKKGSLLKWETTQVTAGQGTSFIIYDRSNIRLLTGSLWILSQENLIVDSGLVRASIQGDGWVEKETTERTLIRNLGGTVAIIGPAPLPAQTIAIGFENWFAGINTLGQAEQGLVRPIEIRHFIPQWAKFSHLPKNEALKRIADYKTAWAPATAESAELYQKIVLRQIASMDAKKAEQDRQAQAQLRENERMKQMFHQRYSDGLSP